MPCTSHTHHILISNEYFTEECVFCSLLRYPCWFPKFLPYGSLSLQPTKINVHFVTLNFYKILCIKPETQKALHISEHHALKKNNGNNTKYEV